MAVIARSLVLILLFDRLRAMRSSLVGLGAGDGDKVQMVPEGDVNVAGGEVQHWLQSVGVESLCQLEVLSFLHRHPITILPPESLARLLGYRMDPVVDALDSLSALQLLKRSALSRGVHSYQFIVPSASSRTDALERLLALSSHRSGRLLLRKHLGRHGTLHEDSQTVRQYLDDAEANLHKLVLMFERSSETVH